MPFPSERSAYNISREKQSPSPFYQRNLQNPVTEGRERGKRLINNDWSQTRYSTDGTKVTLDATPMGIVPLLVNYSSIPALKNTLSSFGNNLIAVSPSEKSSSASVVEAIGFVAFDLN